ncbi:MULTISPECIES: sugar ABC transporter substrate-binding protein [unclassified Paenibacillus]|uniref:ABC transporter substrate-binding protein n=1 Tax=unclassified Paenibacillus TaxID=185978 RepID=UPI0024068C46|nr:MULTISPECIES: sugar ABC transporter substrate-binding protein [unclassified Paenibacillus]MDF9843386.1 multiple sugar transport system substrate-binding protein [Paenibacillus sp. PastF-2]MDF9849974.1 multiple sugar transport system substrate-binding protein [Paenibacillus sp. PastM-2]MDF9856682.1 multiple sugar transport system substrate-binding protein [Paenibacillus sp. PastF-1]MDH6481952.1 multiple sugar transport system substrate-binding protein [Paenibacillus sp. PastH-2]MDH6509377.1 
MSKLKKFTGLVLSLTLLFALAACGGNNESANNSPNSAAGTDQKVTVNMGFWGTAQDLQLYQEAANNISEVYPNITLNIKQYPSSEQFWNVLPGEIAAGVAPDFIKISNEGAFEYIKKDLFTPLDDLISAAKVDMTRYSESSLNIWKVDGKQYAVPNSDMPGMFLINEDLWKKAGLGEYPTTWSEVATAAKALTKGDVHGIVINLDAFHITNYVKSFGGGWGNGTTINSPENVEALQTIFDMYEDGVAVTPKSLGFGWDGEVFSNGQAAMSTGGYWYKGYLKDANPDLKYVAVPVPKGTTQGSTMSSDGYVVLKDAKNKDAALKAAYYMTNDKTESAFMDLGINPAVTKLSDQYFEKNPEFKSIQPALEYSTDFGYPTDTKRFTDELVKKLEDNILGGAKQTPQEILDEIQKDFK